MRQDKVLVMGLVASAILLVSPWYTMSSAGPLNLMSLLTGKGVDVHPYHCDDCGNTHEPDGPCISRHPVEECVVGKKEVFDSKICHEYVSIPETRYRWKVMRITKEIPCPYCKPVCKTEDGERCIGEEKWEKHCTECGELHCKHIQPRMEKAPTKHCEHEPGETTVKVKYWSCVKAPYTVYRQVKQPVCVKQPRYVKVKVPITRYVCENCDGNGCSHCD